MRKLIIDLFWFRCAASTAELRDCRMCEGHNQVSWWAVNYSSLQKLFTATFQFDTVWFYIFQCHYCQVNPILSKDLIFQAVDFSDSFDCICANDSFEFARSIFLND